MSDVVDHYNILSIDRSASANEIKKAYRKLALRYHPDKNKETGAEETFKRINDSYNILSDPVKKAELDSKLRKIINPYKDSFGNPYSYSYSPSNSSNLRSNHWRQDHYTNAKAQYDEFSRRREAERRAQEEARKQKEAEQRRRERQNKERWKEANEMFNQQFTDDGYYKPSWQTNDGSFHYSNYQKRPQQQQQQQQQKQPKQEYKGNPKQKYEKGYDKEDQLDPNLYGDPKPENKSTHDGSWAKSKSSYSFVSSEKTYTGRTPDIKVPIPDQASNHPKQEGKGTPQEDPIDEQEVTSSDESDPKDKQPDYNQETNDNSDNDSDFNFTGSPDLGQSDWTTNPQQQQQQQPRKQEHYDTFQDFPSAFNGTTSNFDNIYDASSTQTNDHIFSNSGQPDDPIVLDKGTEDDPIVLDDAGAKPTPTSTSPLTPHRRSQPRKKWSDRDKIQPRLWRAPHSTHTTTNHSFGSTGFNINTNPFGNISNTYLNNPFGYNSSTSSSKTAKFSNTRAAVEENDMEFEELSQDNDSDLEELDTKTTFKDSEQSAPPTTNHIPKKRTVNSDQPSRQTMHPTVEEIVDDAQYQERKSPFTNGSSSTKEQSNFEFNVNNVPPFSQTNGDFNMDKMGTSLNEPKQRKSSAALNSFMSVDSEDDDEVEIIGEGISNSYSNSNFTDSKRMEQETTSLFNDLLHINEQQTSRTSHPSVNSKTSNEIPIHHPVNTPLPRHSPPPPLTLHDLHCDSEILSMIVPPAPPITETNKLFAKAKLMVYMEASHVYNYQMVRYNSIRNEVNKTVMERCIDNEEDLKIYLKGLDTDVKMNRRWEDFKVENKLTLLKFVHVLNN